MLCHSSAAYFASEARNYRKTMKAVLFLGLCVIALCCALAVDVEQEREKRSSSGEYYRGGYGGQSYYPYYINNNNNNLLNTLLPFLIARLLPAPAAAAPAPAPAGK
ncbi:hypothetical protein MHYP_G00243240 [Metynnis hypsauchen]